SFLQIIEVNLFERKPISSVVAEALKQNPEPLNSNQLNLFGN
ncbi:MAG TPA: IS4 family transposase, partial [Geobacteraceae bacterium]